MKQRRVVHVGKFYPPHMGGIETHLQNLCRALSSSYRVHAIVSNEGPESIEETDGAVNVHRIGTRFTFSSTSFSPGFGDAIRALKPDVVHLHLPNPAATLSVLLSSYLFRTYQGPVVTTYHSDVVRQKILGAAFEPFLRAVLHRSSAIICTSRRYLETSPSASRFSGKAAVIPYGIRDPEMELDAREILALRQRYGPRLVIAVGRLVYYKGFEYLIDAMAQVQGRLMIIGDGPLRQSLEQQIHDRNLRDKVHLLGEIQNDRLTPWYRAADVFALPSIARSEAFGIVQLEAMANGLPVVNTNLDSGVPFVSRHNETGFTVAPRDPAALAEALNTLLADQSLRASFSMAARRRVRSVFTLETMARRTSALYEDVWAGRKPVMELELEAEPVPAQTTATSEVRSKTAGLP